MAHYMHGPQLGFGEDADRQTTLRTIREACIAAARELGEGYRLEPEPISEGGVQFTAWPGKVGDKPYKSVRFCGLRNWPLLTSDFCDDTTIHLESSQGSLGFFLKAFYDAPPFTVRELTVVTAAIASCFAGSSVEKMPSADRLARAYRRALQETPSLCSA